jgi:hypothetical protein
MSDTIDLTSTDDEHGDEDQDNARWDAAEQQQQQQKERLATAQDHQEQSRRRSREEQEKKVSPPPPPELPAFVCLVLHDKIPQANWRQDEFTPDRQDTTIVGIFYNYNDAARAAGEYVENKFDVEVDDFKDDDDDDEPTSHFDWDGEGWHREERYSANDCDDRIYIEEQRVR